MSNQQEKIKVNDEEIRVNENGEIWFQGTLIKMDRGWLSALAEFLESAVQDMEENPEIPAPPATVVIPVEIVENAPMPIDWMVKDG